MSNYFSSLENQTFKDFEVIIIDDSSTDESYIKLVEYKKKSKLNISILQSECNSGPGNARNIGIIHSKGEFITFIDNDDWIDHTCLEQINNVLNSHNVGCVIYDYYISNGRKKLIAKSMYRGSSGIIDLSDAIMYARNHTVGKFYNKECLIKNKILFPTTLRRCEDVAFVAKAIDACKSIYYYNVPLYVYLQRNTSLSHNKNMDESDMIAAFRILEKDLGKKYAPELSNKSVVDLFYGVILLMCKSKRSNYAIRKYIEQYIKMYPHWRSFEILNYIGIYKRIFIYLASKKRIFLIKILSIIHSILI